jgi:hypothetical protein
MGNVKARPSFPFLFAVLLLTTAAGWFGFDDLILPLWVGYFVARDAL